MYSGASEEAEGHKVRLICGVCNGDLGTIAYKVPRGIYIEDRHTSIDEPDVVWTVVRPTHDRFKETSHFKAPNDIGVYCRGCQRRGTMSVIGIRSAMSQRRKSVRVSVSWERDIRA